MSSLSRAARFTALAGGGVVAVGAVLPWVTYVGARTPEQSAPFTLVDVALATVVAISLLYAYALAPGERDPRSVALYVGVASLLLVLSLTGVGSGALGTHSDVVTDPPSPAEYTLSGLTHGGGWVAAFAAAGAAWLAATGWDRRRAVGVAVCGAVIYGVTATLLVPAGGLENASLYRRPPAAEPTFQRGLYVTLTGGIVAYLGGVGGALAVAPARRPDPESAILAGLAVSAAGVLLPWGVESVPYWRWLSVPAWSSLFLVVLCPYAAVVLAEGLTRRLALVAGGIGTGLLAALLGELAVVNAGQVAADATFPALLAPGRVFPVGYYLVTVGAAALLYGGRIGLRRPT